MHRSCVLLTVAAVVASVTGWALADDWPQFRGPNRDGISAATGLLRAWPEGGPKVLWSTAVCQGYSAAAIQGERVYFNDYDLDAKEWLVRCLSIEDGKELWRFTEPRKIRPNHGITRSIPAVDGKYVFSLDPKCTFHCLDAETGEELWRKNLVKEYKTRIPSWYNGQCPLIEPDRVIIAIGGQALAIAFDKATGAEIWRTPNEEKWPLSHASLMPASLGGVKQYLYSTLKGIHALSAEDGSLLWHHPFKFNVAVAPSPLVVNEERVFMTAGYDAGSVMIRVYRDGDSFRTEQLFNLTTGQWNSEVHTPIVYKDRMFAVGKKRRGLFTCLDFDGNIIWTSTPSFGLGSYMLADGMFFVLQGATGMLRLIEANTTEYRELASAQVLEGNDVWGPAALSRGRMVIRDMSKMVCIQVGQTVGQTEAKKQND